MRNYFFSILVHIILFLLLIFSSFSTPSEVIQPQSVIYVNFSSSETSPLSASSSETKAEPRKKETAAAKTMPEKLEPQRTEESKPNEIKEKNLEETTLKTSQKPKEVSKKPNPKVPAKEITPSIEEQKLKEKQQQKLKEIEEKRKAEEAEEAEKKEKVSYFKSLFNKSKNIADSQKTESAGESPNTSDSDGKSSVSKGNSNIEGDIGNRQVLQTPSINDNSQKQGRVVVKICVDSSGKVITAKYTQVGSTTADSYLIGLAEKGALEYRFSTSDSDRECGRVIIDFRLRA